MAFSVAIAIVALALAYFRFVKNGSTPKEDSEMEGLEKVVYNKYYLDEIYESIFTNPMRKLSAFFYNTVERKGIGRLTFGTGNIANTASGLVSKMQTGSTGTYLFIMCSCIAVVVMLSVGGDLLSTIKSYFQNKL